MCFSFKLFVQHSVLVEIFMSEPVVDWSCSSGQSLLESLSAEDALAFGAIDQEQSPPPPCHLQRIHLLEGKKHWHSQATSLLCFYIVGFSGLGILFPFSLIYPLVCTWSLRNKRNKTVKFWRILQAQRGWGNSRNSHRDEYLLKEAVGFVTIYGWSQRKKQGPFSPRARIAQQLLRGVSPTFRKGSAGDHPCQRSSETQLWIISKFRGMNVHCSRQPPPHSFCPNGGLGSVC